MMNRKDLEKLGERISSLDRIIVTTHLNPDPDGIGSQIAMESLLRRMGKEVVLLNSDPVPERLQFLDPGNKIQNLTDNPEFEPPWEGESFVIILDTSDPDRIGRVGRFFNTGVTNWIVIDHHDHGISDSFQKFQFSDLGSTSEVMYELMTSMNQNPSPEEARGLYTGICADTGHFRFRKTSPRTHTIAAELLKSGIHPDEITEKLQFQAPINRLKLRKILYNSLQIHESNRIAWMCLEANQMADLGLSTDDLEGFVNELIEPVEIVVGVLFSERGPEKTKMSMRSKGEVDLVPMVQNRGGGGHRNACGVMLPLPMDRAVETMIPELFQYLKNRYF